MHSQLSNQGGLEDGPAWTGGAAHWGLPYTINGQSCVVWGRLAGKQNPTLPLLPACLT
jgi:hypothetical protein